jgi:hypothetical protein
MMESVAGRLVDRRTDRQADWVPLWCLRCHISQGPAMSAHLNPCVGVVCAWDPLVEVQAYCINGLNDFLTALQRQAQMAPSNLRCDIWLVARLWRRIQRAARAVFKELQYST